MDETIYTVTGTLTDGDTVKLDKSIPLPAVKVRVTIQEVSLSNTPPLHNRYAEVMAEIRRRQEARNHHAPTAQEVEARIAEERAGWDLP